MKSRAKASSNAGIDLSDNANYTTVVSGTGVDFAWEGTACVLLKNSESSASRNFTFTVPVPSGSGLTAIGSTSTSKTLLLVAKRLAAKFTAVVVFPTPPF